MRDLLRKLLGDDRRRRRRRRDPEESSGDPRRQSRRRIHRLLEDGAQEVSLRSLKRSGLHSIRVIDGSSVQGVVNESIDEALRQRGLELSGEEREEVAAYSEAQLRELMEENERLTAAKSEADAERERLEERRRQLEGDMDALRGELDEKLALLEEAREAAGQPQRIRIEIGEESFQELEGRMRHLLERMARDGELIGHDASGEPHLELDGLERELTALVSRVVAEVRRAQAEATQAGSTEEIERLERRIAKLNEALEERETALRKLAKMKAIDPGVASLYDVVQGLSLEDPAYERKSELLREVFVQNLELQGREVHPEDLERKPAPARRHDAADGEPAVPADFAAPAELSAGEETSF